MFNELSFPFVVSTDDVRGSVVQFDHESTNLNLCASLSLEQLDALISALQAQRKHLAGWEAELLIL
jgi:hypothetical protein